MQSVFYSASPRDHRLGLLFQQLDQVPLRFDQRINFGCLAVEESDDVVLFRKTH